MTLLEIIALFGIPSAITGLFVWLMQRRMDKQEERQLEREKNQEQLMKMMINSTHANSVGIKAIARAVQRIPDAHCNGDMTSALKDMEELEQAEHNFFMDQGIKHILAD